MKYSKDEARGQLAGDIILFKHLIEKLNEKEISNLKASISISEWDGTLFTLTNESGLISCQWKDSETTSEFIDRTIHLMSIK